MKGWTWGFKHLPPGRFWEWPRFIRMILRHKKQRDFIIEYGQTMITDVDNCIECMKACPVGTEWKKSGQKKRGNSNSGRGMSLQRE